MELTLTKTRQVTIAEIASQRAREIVEDVTANFILVVQVTRRNKRSLDIGALRATGQLSHDRVATHLMDGYRQSIKGRRNAVLIVATNKVYR